jgi:hypothetical protein
MAKSPPIYAIFKDYGKQETFRCDGCQRVLKKGWSDEDAVREMQTLYPEADPSETLIYCDDCIDDLGLS